ncbi:MAG: efflux RND transporter periplasmic adaptor subunit [Patescibacteria group bacterium]
MWQIIKLKKVWIPAIILILIIGGVWYGKNQSQKPVYTTEIVSNQTIKQTVSATGTLKAAEDIDLGFKTSGKLSWVNVKVGDNVRAGQILASLESRDVQASVLSAQANLAKLQAGAQSEDIAVTQTSVDAAQTTLENARESLVNTKSSQNRAVSNALAQLVGLPAQALPAKWNISTATLSVSGTYTGSELGTYTIRFDNPANLMYSVYGLENVIGTEGSRTTPTAFGTHGLKIQISTSGTIVAGDTWTVEIPNTASTSYATYQAAYEAALTTQKQQVEAAEATVRSAEQALAQTQAQLSFKQAPTRSYDILYAEAQVNAARGSLAQAQANLSDRTLVAPTAGLITKINNQVGESVTGAAPIIVLLAQGDYEIKVKVPEADIAKLQIGQAVDISFDAFTQSEKFIGHISFIDPASTIVSDVVYYEITINLPSTDARMKPGMTVNLEIATAEKNNVLTIPSRALRYENNKTYVDILKSDDVIERKEITIGLLGDAGLTEVLSGLQAGDKVITRISNGK